MIDADFLSVFTPIAVTYAVTSGMLLGSTLLAYVGLRRPPLTYLPPGKQALLAFFVLGVLGTVFFAGQITQALIEHKGIEAEPVRILARYALWLVFSVAVAISNTWVMGFAKKAGK